MKSCATTTIWLTKFETSINRMPKLKCVVACADARGMALFHATTFHCTEAQYRTGNHKEQAKLNAMAAGYTGAMVVFDERDGPAFLFEQLKKSF